MKEIQIELLYNVGDKAQITYCMALTKTPKLRNTLHIVESLPIGSCWSPRHYKLSPRLLFMLYNLTIRCLAEITIYVTKHGEKVFK